MSWFFLACKVIFLLFKLCVRWNADNNGSAANYWSTSSRYVWRSDISPFFDLKELSQWVLLLKKLVTEKKTLGRLYLSIHLAAKTSCIWWLGESATQIPTDMCPKLLTQWKVCHYLLAIWAPLQMRKYLSIYTYCNCIKLIMCYGV